MTVFNILLILGSTIYFIRTGTHDSLGLYADMDDFLRDMVLIFVLLAGKFYIIIGTILSAVIRFRIQIDSENEIKPYVTLSISGDEVVNTSDLPVDYESIMNEAKEYNLVFTVYDNNKSYQFNSMTRVTVKKHNSLSSN